ncbi:MAG TPA: VCBS repeat-containing protein, partial [Planctomycetaceae bacterium]|nr:VCBS repeat-containing protein [Planctomycetaceae bacterium]
MQPARFPFCLLSIALALPLAVALVLPRLPALGHVEPAKISFQSTFPASTLPLEQSVLGRAPQGEPLITNVQIVDLDRDGVPDVLVCDAVLNRVVWYRQASRGVWEEHILGDVDLAAPAHASLVDMEGDGDLDLVVAVLGSVYAADEPIGKVVWLENDGAQQFTTHLVLDDLRRVSDVQAGDLTGDGRPDLVVAEFGFDRGRLLWLENMGDLKFRDRELYAVPGAIHVPLVDLNGDGRLDIATVVSQEDEEVCAFENLGQGQFRRRSLYAQGNFDFGSSGLFVSDLNGDGRPDLLLTAGDNLEITYPAPQPWHGCFLLENKGDWKFEFRRLATVPGVYAAGVGDLNGDGSPDIALGCEFNDWHRPDAASVVWLENDGRGNFTTGQIASAPTHISTVAVGDLNGDGRADVV